MSVGRLEVSESMRDVIVSGISERDLKETICY